MECKHGIPFHFVPKRNTPYVVQPPIGCPTHSATLDHLVSPPALSHFLQSFPFSLAGLSFKVQLVFLVHPTSKLLVQMLSLSMSDHKCSPTVLCVS